MKSNGDVYAIAYSKKAIDNIPNIKAAGLYKKAKKLIDILRKNPYQPPLVKLNVELEGMFSRRINKKHRLVYEIDENSKIIRISALWTHYE